jgi:hypothetical protein
MISDVARGQADARDCDDADGCPACGPQAAGDVVPRTIVRPPWLAQKLPVRRAAAFTCIDDVAGIAALDTCNSTREPPAIKSGSVRQFDRRARTFLRVAT